MARRTADSAWLEAARASKGTMTTPRRLVLRANALYVGAAGLAGLIFDVRGVLLGVGPQGRLLAGAPHAAIGFVEAHGLAVILAVMMWRSSSVRSWHLAAAAMEVLLGTANLAFWEMFVATDALAVGYVTTALHWSFVLAQLLAAFAAPGIDPRGARTGRLESARAADA
jgi:hypothetical protein